MKVEREKEEDQPTAWWTIWRTLTLNLTSISQQYKNNIFRIHDYPLFSLSQPTESLIPYSYIVHTKPTSKPSYHKQEKAKPAFARAIHLFFKCLTSARTVSIVQVAWIYTVRINKLWAIPKTLKTPKPPPKNQSKSPWKTQQKVNINHSPSSAKQPPVVCVRK